MSKSRSSEIVGKAVIYLRVSSEEQVTNFSLSTQEEICTKEAANRNLAIDRVFREEGRSAKTIKGRPQLLELMDYCRKNRRNISTVIVYRIDRVARQAADYLSIRSQLQRYGIEIISSTEPTGSSPTEKLIETILAGFAQLDNDVRSERTKNGLKARFTAGLPINKVPIGYSNYLGHTIKDPETYDYIKLAWEKMATGNYTLPSLAKYLNEQGVTTNSFGIRYKVRPQTLSRVFRSRFYCGYLQSAKLGESKGQHEPMISEEMYYQVQSILDGRGPNRSGSMVKHLVDNPEFPLRRKILCSKCGLPMTGALSKGKQQKYGYYFCKRRCGTPSSIPTHVADEKMEQLLKDIAPKPAAVEEFIKLLRTKYAEGQKKVQYSVQVATNQLEQLKERRQALIEKNLEGIYDDDIFKEQLELLDKKIAEAYALTRQQQLKSYDINLLCKFVKEKLAHPYETYINGDVETKKNLLCSIYPQGIKWMYPGLSNTGISPQYQQIRDITKSYVPYGEPGGSRTPNQCLKRALLYH